MDKLGAKAGWFFVILGAIGLVGSILLTAASPPDEPLGRLGLPAGAYGPVLIAITAVVLIYGVFILIRRRGNG